MRKASKAVGGGAVSAAGGLEAETDRFRSTVVYPLHSFCEASVLYTTPNQDTSAGENVLARKKGAWTPPPKVWEESSWLPSWSWLVPRFSKMLKSSWVGIFRLNVATWAGYIDIIITINIL